MLLFGQQEGHLAFKNRVVGCWCGYVSGSRCRFAYGHSWCHCHFLPLAAVNPDWFYLPSWYYLSGTGSPK